MESDAGKMRIVTGVGIGERSAIGKLRVADAGALANGSEIAVCREPIDVKRALELFRADFSAIVCVSEEKGELADAVRSFGLPALLVSDETIEKCIGGENAVLCPQKGSLFISPTVDIIDEFRKKLDVSSDEIELNRICVCDLFGEFCGQAVLLSLDDMAEDEFFENCLRCLDESDEGIYVFVRDGTDVNEHIRAIMRAAVYGKVAVALSVSSLREYSKLCSAFDRVAEELREEGREFEMKISRGVLIDRTWAMIFSRELAEQTDFMIIDMGWIKNQVCDEEFEQAEKRCVEIISEAADNSGAKVLKLKRIVGNKDE